MELQLLKEKLVDVNLEKFGDSLLMRFLRARNMSVEKAEVMLRNHLEWRKKERIDERLESYQTPELIQKYGVTTLLGYDKEGSPVFLSTMGLCDTNGFLESLSVDDFVDFTIFGLNERIIKECEQQSKKLGRKIEQATVIEDLDGFSIFNLYNKKLLQLYPKIAQVASDNYPEVLKHYIIVNAPKFYPALYRVFAPFLSDETKQKFEIHSKNDNWQSILLEIIDADQLPVYYGGTRVGKNGCPRCSDWVSYGGKIPEKYFRKNMSNSGHLMHVDNTKYVRVNRSDIELISVYATKGETLQWRYQTLKNDIKFSLKYKEDTKNTYTETLFEAGRTNCDEAFCEGTYFCQRSGFYVLEFDNSFSWFSHKVVYYQIWLTKDPGNLAE